MTERNGGEHRNSPSPVRWTMPLIEKVREMSERGLSDSGIAVVLEMYEGMPPLTEHQVRGMRQRIGIEKPMSGARREQVRGWGRGEGGVFAGDKRGV